jgi:hypothetical protein
MALASSTPLVPFVTAYATMVPLFTGPFTAVPLIVPVLVAPGSVTLPPPLPHPESMNKELSIRTKTTCRYFDLLILDLLKSIR